MLPNSITQAIKKKAEEFVTKRRISSASIDKVKDPVAHNSYASGYSDAIEEMILFAEWINENDYKTGHLNQHWFKWSGMECDGVPYTTEELLTKYFETKQ